MKSHLWKPTISKISGAAYPRTPLGWLAPLIYAACETSALPDPDQISGRHGSRDTTMTASLICKSVSQLEILLSYDR